MNTIDKEVQTEYIIQKSRFITYLFKVYTEDDAKIKLEELRKLYKDATHCCYAYIIDNIKRFNDDGEPGGTAGMPILHILETQECNHILAVVIRYFGGIKLGAGGLVRAYTKAITTAFSQTEIKKEVKAISLKIVFSYDNVKKIDYLLENYTIIEKNFNTNIEYLVYIPDDKKEQVLNSLESLLISYAILDQNIYT